MYLDGGNVRTTTYSTGMKNMIINRRGYCQIFKYWAFAQFFRLDC